MMSQEIRWLLSLCLVLGELSFANGQNTEVSGEFFDDDTVVSLVIEAPVSKLSRQYGSDPDWLPGVVHYEDTSGIQQTFTIEIRARGNFRRKPDSCSFPPYLLNFKKSEVKGTVFAGLDKVKVVSHCRTRPRSYSKHIYKEYLAYKTYNLLTDSSFKVRLMSAHYVNPGKKPSGEPKVAFMIESIEELAERNDGSEITPLYALPGAFIPEVTSIAHMFEFFLGNTDFSFVNGMEECCHNVKIIQTSKGLLPVPFDFDMTGLVDVPYAVVNPKFRIKSPQDRYYRGFETSDEILQQTVKRFLEKKDAIIDLWSNNDLLPENERDAALKFIGDFYEIIENPERLQKEVINRMRSPEKLESALLKQYGD